jgi:hypothetical protein
MCNRFRSIKEWSDLPRDLYNGPRLNFEFNPNVALTELVPILLARTDGPITSVIARFGIYRLYADAQGAGTQAEGWQQRTHNRFQRPWRASASRYAMPPLPTRATCYCATTAPDFPVMND